MIEVMGGYSKIVNVTNDVNDENIEIVVYIKMFYRIETAKDEMIKQLKGYGFKTEVEYNGQLKDTMYKIITIDPVEVK